jgi:hypothetical protein
VGQSNTMFTNMCSHYLEFSKTSWAIFPSRPSPPPPFSFPLCSPTTHSFLFSPLRPNTSSNPASTNGLTRQPDLVTTLTALPLHHTRLAGPLFAHVCSCWTRTPSSVAPGVHPGRSHFPHGRSRPRWELIPYSTITRLKMISKSKRIRDPN